MAIRRPDETDRESAAELRRRLIEQRQSDQIQSRQEQAREERAREAQRTQRGDDVTISPQVRERFRAAQRQRAGQPASAASAAPRFSQANSQRVSQAQPVRTRSAIAAQRAEQPDRQPGLRFDPEVTARLREAAQERQAQENQPNQRAAAPPSAQQPADPAGSTQPSQQLQQPAPQTPADQQPPAAQGAAPGQDASRPQGQGFVTIRQSDGTAIRMTRAQFNEQRRQRAQQAEQQNARRAGQQQRQQAPERSPQQPAGETEGPPSLTINFDALSRAFGGGQQGQNGAAVNETATPNQPAAAPPPAQQPADPAGSTQPSQQSRQPAPQAPADQPPAAQGAAPAQDASRPQGQGFVTIRQSDGTAIRMTRAQFNEQRRQRAQQA